VLPDNAIGADWIWFSLPLNLSIVLFIAFAYLVVHVGQRMVERTSLMFELSERQSSIAHTSLCVGSLVWALDVAGLFLYRNISAQDARLVPAVLALIIMVGSTRLTVPALTTTLKPWRIIVSALGLAVGMIFAHMALMASIGKWTGSIRWSAICMSVFIACLVSAGLTFRHRFAQLRAAKSKFRTLLWYEELIAGFFILFLHLCLVNAFVIMPDDKPGVNNGFLVLLVLVLFGIVLSFDQVFNIKIEEKRQQAFNRALALMRSTRPELTENTRHQIALIVERLSTLLAPESMKLHFQPICPIQEANERIRCEALLRLNDRDLGSIHPELFFLACERAGKTTWADRIVIVHALNSSMPWTHSEIRCCGISVNVAPATLLESGFVNWLAALLKEKSVPKDWLQLEITEHAMISQAEPLARILDQLSLFGVAVTMDDFGTGFSSLTTLADLPINGIKCDRAFVRGITTDSTRQILLQHVCELGKGLGLLVTVEGIETQADLAIARDKGAGAVQGFLFAKAMPPDQIPAWIETHRAMLNMCVEEIY
jgi:EAL domain-containing protein (putative c-di-GMP-specific phosphodiesterase class I)